MKIFTVLVSGFLMMMTLGSTLCAQSFEPCVTEIEFQKAAEKDPSLLQIREQMELETARWIAENPGAESRGGGNYIIPVVWHVVHTCGAENISDAQIHDQMRILNEDFQRTNANASSTPLAFTGVAADTEIEFRMAQLDPSGNCTNGINRIYSSLTHSADPRNAVKAVSYWPRHKYLNIWVVSSIINTSGSGGTILGYAQFPGGSSTTDGIVLKSDYVGSIGTGASNNYVGRTATHEVGHWLSLRHIWGDATCGNDFVNDTPTQEDSNFGCVSFPHITCNNGPTGDMFMNYMDYSDGDCQNIFTQGQKARMHSTLNSPLSSRNNLWTTANLAATGVNLLPTLCAPIAEFCPDPVRICEGTAVTFSDQSTNGQISSYLWSFPGGNPSSSTDPNPSVTYSTWGDYDVSLTVSNASGMTSKTRNRHVIVSRAAAWYSIPYSEGFESINFPGGFWFTENPGGNGWEQTSDAAYSGIKSIKLINYSGNTQDPDAFVTPTYNLSNVSQTELTFKLAFAARSTSNTDKLQVFVSTNCGQTWSIRYTKSGLALATAGLVSSNFIPTQLSQWREETINLSTSSVSGRDNVMFKFVYTNDTGNNMFIDDINITGVVSTEEILSQQIQLALFPNPASDQALLSFNLVERVDAEIYITDVTGRRVQNIASGQLSSGDHNYSVAEGLSGGMYFIHLIIDGEIISRKLIKE